MEIQNDNPPQEVTNHAYQILDIVRELHDAMINNKQNSGSVIYESSCIYINFFFVHNLAQPNPLSENLQQIRSLSIPINKESYEKNKDELIYLLTGALAEIQSTPAIDENQSLDNTNLLLENVPSSVSIFQGSMVNYLWYELTFHYSS